MAAQSWRGRAGAVVVAMWDGVLGIVWLGIVWLGLGGCNDDNTDQAEASSGGSAGSGGSSGGGSSGSGGSHAGSTASGAWWFAVAVRGASGDPDYLLYRRGDADWQQLLPRNFWDGAGPASPQTGASSTFGPRTGSSPPSTVRPGRN